MLLVILVNYGNSTLQSVQVFICTESRYVCVHMHVLLSLPTDPQWNQYRDNEAMIMIIASNQLYRDYKVVTLSSIFRQNVIIVLIRSQSNKCFNII